MRVVDVTSFFSESCGGIKTYYREKARHLPRLGVECHFVVPGRRAGCEPLGDGVLHRLPGPPLPGNRQYRLFRRAAAVADLIEGLRPDVIEIGSHYRLPGIVRGLLERRPGSQARVAGFFHSDIAGALVSPLAGRLPRPLADRLLAGAWRWVQRQHAGYDVTLAASRAAAALLRDHGVARVRWVGLGVDIDVFRPRDRQDATPSGPPTLVYAGRLSADKGLSVLLGAVDAIHRLTGAELLVIGEGPARRRLLRFARHRPYLKVQGYLDGRAHLADTLATAAAVITPGAAETFSLTTAEAMACATPVLVADGGGARELVADSGGGLLFRARSSAALAEAAADLLARPPRARAAMGQRGRAHILAHYTWPEVMQRLLAAYRGQAPELP
jgi:glycosyltransferase involved in cell wall biosynthesis